MGAGHDGAANELRKRLERQGHQVRIVDFLDCCPFGIGWFIKVTYLLQLRVAPWSYDLTYRLWYKLPSTWSFIVRLDTFVAGKRLRRAITETDADVVVSTYPLSSLVLGNMRKKRWLKVPVITYLTDFAVHPLWVHPHVDVHLATSPYAAATARTRGGDDARSPGPLVGDRFRPADRHRPRRGPRAELGLTDDARGVLVVAGSWGVGDIPGTVDAIVAAGDFHPVVVCGADEKLQAELSARGHGTILGWRDDMPRLMAACDVMVENAGWPHGQRGVRGRAAGGHVPPDRRPRQGQRRGHGRARRARGTPARRTSCATRSTVLTRPGPERSRQIADRARAVRGRRRRRRARRGRAAQRPRHRAADPDAEGAAPDPRRGRFDARAVRAAHPRRAGDRRARCRGGGAAEAGARPRVPRRPADGRRAREPARSAPASTACTPPRSSTPPRPRVAERPIRLLVAREIDVGNGGWGQGRAFRPLRAQADVISTTDVISKTADVQDPRVRPRASLRRVRPALRPSPRPAARARPIT